MPRASRRRTVSLYDADNRVDVAGGSLENGQIVIDNRAGSIEKTYDLAGDAVT